MGKMKKVIVLQGSLFKYRDPIYSYLNKDYDLTLGYMHENKLDEFYNFYKVPFIKMGSIFLPTKSFIDYVKKFEIIIIMPDLHYINYCFLPFYFKEKHIISWSIGMRASYTLLYDTSRRKTFLDFLLMFIFRKCKANLFYYKWPLKFWGNLLDHKKIYIAKNTVEIVTTKKKIETKKNIILFVGSLIEGKGLEELLEAYYEAEMYKKFEFIIIGDGILRKKIKEYVKEKDLMGNIKLLNGIYELDNLRPYFEKSLLSISPKQAGLSVIISFGFGVPFVTYKDAITGGERLNIINGYNGVLLNDKEDLKDFFINLVRSDLVLMGENAAKYYEEKLDIKFMRKAFMEAINL